MEIVYTPHLEFRLKVRKIPYDLPQKIYQHSRERYYDNLSKHYIAIDRIEFKGKIREMALIVNI